MRISRNFRQCGLCLGLTLLSAINLTSCPVPIPGGESLKVLLATGAADPAKTLPKALVPVPEGAILSLEARVHSVRILPADSDPVLVFAGPVTVDLLSLSSVAALLSSTTAPAGAYEGIEVKVSSATLILATSPDEVHELVLAENGNYSLDFAFEIVEDSSGLLYIELGGLSVFQQDDSSFLLAPELSAALRESMPDTRLEGTIASVDSATESLVLTVGSGSFTVDYDGAAIFLPSDYDTPSGTTANLVSGTRLAVTGTVGLDDRIAPETIEVLDLPGTPGDEDGGMVTVCYFYGEDPVVATTITVRRDRLPDLLAQGAIAGPCDGAEPFTLTYAAGPGGTLSGETTQSVVPGASGTAVTAIPDEGFAFVSWSDGSTLNPRTEVSVGADLSVTANFAELFTLTYAAGEGGTLSGETTQQVIHGESGSRVTAVRDSGYQFTQWSDGRTDNPRTDENVTEDLVVTAQFTKIVSLEYIAGEGGSLTGETAQRVLLGADATPVTAVPDPDFAFTGWSDGNQDNPRTDLDVSGDLVVTANFAELFDLTYAAGPNGLIVGAAAQTVPGGLNGTPVTAVADTDFGFVRWSDGRVDNPRTDSAIAGDVSVTAEFATAVTLTYSAGPNGRLEGVVEQIVGVGGTSSPVTAVPDTGFVFLEWSDGRTDNPRIDQNVPADLSVSAAFTEAHTLTYTAGANGTLAGASTQAVRIGGNGTAVTAVPNTGFAFSRWSDGRTDNPRTDLNVMEDISVQAIFEELFALEYTAGANGTLSGETIQHVISGGSGTPVLALGNTGFGLANWSDGVTDNPRTDTNVLADLQVTAIFAPRFKIEYGEGANGHVEGVLFQAVEPDGDGTTVTAVADEGYAFSQWSDGSTDNPRTDTGITADLEVAAEFVEIPEMSPVPAGSFVMGRLDSGDDAGQGTEELPRHDVTLSAYEIGTYEITVQQYCDFLNYMNHSTRQELRQASGELWDGHNVFVYYGNGTDLDVFFGYSLPECSLTYQGRHFVPKTKVGLPGATSYSMAENPTTAVTWYGAVLYTNWLSEIQGLDPVYDTTTWEADFTKNGYHLPTEAQWERAAAWDGEKHWTYGFTADTLTTRDRATYYNGVYNPPPDFGNVNFINPLGLVQDALTPYTSPVGWFNGINISPNGNILTQDSRSPIGAYDMSGNISEWCHDWYGASYYAASASIDPAGPEDGEEKVFRGGAWGRTTGNINLRTAKRNQFPPPQIDGIVGFRIARTTGTPPEFSLAYAASENGSVEGESAQVVAPGGSGSPVLAVGNDGFGFSAWSDGRTDNPRTDTNVRRDIAVSAEFSVAVTLRYTVGANGSIEGAAEQEVGTGGTGTSVEAIPNLGFAFDRWSDGRTDNPRVDEEVTADLTVEAIFVPVFTLEYAAGPNGQVQGVLQQFVKQGGIGSAVTAVADSSYIFVDWSDGRTVNPRTDSTVTADVSVTANFAEVATLTYLAGPNGTIQGNTEQEVLLGGTGTAVTAIANGNFSFLEWSDGRTDNPRIDAEVTGDVTVTANFVAGATLTYTAGPNGTISGDFQQEVVAGGSGTAVTAVANDGFDFVDWSDGRTDNPRVDTNVTANINVTANFIARVTLSYDATENGTVTGTTTQVIQPGDDGTEVAAVPNDGYLFLQWSDGSVANPRQDLGVTSDVVVTADFMPKVAMLPVPGGTFPMGPTDAGDDLDYAFANEFPRHDVTLTEYEIGKYEVTNEEYLIFLNFMKHPARAQLRRVGGGLWGGENENIYFGDNLTHAYVYRYGEVSIGYDHDLDVAVPLIKQGLPEGTSYSTYNHPVTESTWFGSAIYCNWLSERYGYEPVYNLDTWEADFSKNGFRLPTEAEWECAAAWDGSKHWIYGFTSDTLTGRDRANYYMGLIFQPPPDQGNLNFVNPQGLVQDSQTTYSSPVGWFNGINISPNQNVQTIDSKSPIGAYDMSGNLSEWCHDWYSPTYYAESPSVDPTGPETGEKRVLRGGAWARLLAAARNRTAFRFSFDPTDSDGIVGFRVVRRPGTTPP